MINDFNTFHKDSYYIDCTFRGLNHSFYTVYDLKNNTSFERGSDEIYNDIKNLKAND